MKSSLYNSFAQTITKPQSNICNRPKQHPPKASYLKFDVSPTHQQAHINPSAQARTPSISFFGCPLPETLRENSGKVGLRVSASRAKSARQTAFPRGARPRRAPTSWRRRHASWNWRRAKSGSSGLSARRLIGVSRLPGSRVRRVRRKRSTPAEKGTRPPPPPIGGCDNAPISWQRAVGRGGRPDLSGRR